MPCSTTHGPTVLFLFPLQIPSFSSGPTRRSIPFASSLDAPESYPPAAGANPRTKPRPSGLHCPALTPTPHKPQNPDCWEEIPITWYEEIPRAGFDTGRHSSYVTVAFLLVCHHSRHSQNSFSNCSPHSLASFLSPLLLRGSPPLGLAPLQGSLEEANIAALRPKGPDFYQGTVTAGIPPMLFELRLHWNADGPTGRACSNRGTLIPAVSFHCFRSPRAATIPPSGGLLPPSPSVGASLKAPSTLR